MDTRLKSNNNESTQLKMKPKNNKRIFFINLIALILTVIIGIAAIKVYPKIDEMARKTTISQYLSYDFARILTKNNFVLYKEALEAKQGKVIEANEIYIKPKSEFSDSDVYEHLKCKMNDFLVKCKGNLEDDLQNLDYAVLDNDENILKSNNKNNLSGLIKANNPDILKDKYSFYIAINYDENGNMNVDNVYGGDENIISYLSNYELKDLVYTNNYEINKPIKNMTFIYSINKDLKYTNDQIYRLLEKTQRWSRRDITYAYVLILAGIVAILGLFTPFKFEKEIIICKKLFKVPLEIIFMLMGIIIGFMFAESSDLVFYTLNGDFTRKILAQIGINDYVGQKIIYLCNILYWLVFITSIFISITVIKNIFNVGLIKYFKEKTLIGIIIMFLSRNAKPTYKFLKTNAQKTYENVDNIIENADLKDKSNKFISLIYNIYRLIKRKGKQVYENLCNMINNVDLSENPNRFIINIIVINFIIILISGIVFIFGAASFIHRQIELMVWAILILILYNTALFILIRKYLNNVNTNFKMILNATNKIADGKLDAKIEEDAGLFNPFKVQIEKIQVGFKKAVDEEVKSQRMKTELISNVSHDLKTPLTSIITYVDLLKKESITDEERNSYIDTLDRKSQRLKFLIEDLFEVSKATSGNITLNLVKVDIVELMKQTQVELEDKINNAELNIKNNFPKNKVILELDSQKTFRIFENLLTNVVKYSMKGSRVYIDIIAAGERIEITIKNMSAEEITFNTFDIVERFQRGDKSRNAEGSGLGLAIVKSFTEVQGGKFNIEIDGDLFKVILLFKK